MSDDDIDGLLDRVERWIARVGALDLTSDSLDWGELEDGWTQSQWLFETLEDHREMGDLDPVQHARHDQLYAAASPYWRPLATAIWRLSATDNGFSRSSFGQR